MYTSSLSRGPHVSAQAGEDQQKGWNEAGN